MPLDATRNTVVKVTAKLSGAGGPEGVDVVGLQQWILRFGLEIIAFREAVVDVICWIANETPS